MAILAGAAAGVALFDYFSSKGQQLSITDDVTTQMSMSATTNVATECFVALDTSQTVNIVPGALSAAQNQALSAACAQCQSDISTIYKARQKLEADAQIANPNYQPQTANPTLDNMMQTGGLLAPTVVPQTSPSQAALGPCAAICANVVVVGIYQQAQLTAKQDCTVTNDISTSLQQNLQGQISAYLKNQQDIVGQLESAFTSNSEAISANLSNTMGQNVTSNFVEDLSQAMSAVQSFAVTGNSVLAANITQSFTGSMVGSLNVSNSVNDQLRQSASYSIAQSLLNKNDTIGDLSTDFLQVINTMSQLMEELTTQILIIIGAVLAAVMLVIGSLYIFNKNFHSWANHALGTAADAQIEHHRLMQTDAAYRQQVAQDQQQDFQQQLAVRQQAVQQTQAQTEARRQAAEQALLAREQAATHAAEAQERYRTMTPAEQAAERQRLAAGDGASGGNMISRSSGFVAEVAAASTGRILQTAVTGT